MKKYTYGEVKSYFEKRNLTLLSTEYVNCKTPLKYICNKHIDKGMQTVTFDSVKNQSVYVCPYCSKENVRIKNRVDISRIQEACDKLDFKFIDTFIKGQHTYVRYICNKHKDKGVQEKIWTSFKKTKGCPYCNGKTRTSNDFYSDVKRLLPNVYIKENQYKDRNSRINCKCLICGYNWVTSAESLLLGHGCWNCHINKVTGKIKKTEQEYKEELYSAHPTIKLISKYNGSKDKIKCECQVCCNIWETNPHSLLNLKYGCPKCANQNISLSKRITHEEYEQKLHIIMPHIKPISKYVVSDEKMEYCCTLHNKTYWQLPYEALSGKNGCPICKKQSNGENSVSKFLENNNIQYISQYRFDDCKNIRTLPFDFYLPDYNTCIEYDGELHYKAVDYFGGDEALSNTQFRDDIKTQYCLNNNIRLIRIPYWEFNNIDKILSETLLTNKNMRVTTS